MNYFALHPDLITGAQWISREHGCLEVEMETIKISVSKDEATRGEAIQE